MISVAQMQAFLEYGPDKVPMLTALRDEVIALFEKLSNGLWNARADHVQDELAECQSRVFWLRLLPVTAITSVETKAIGEATWNLEDPTAYELVRGRELRIASGYWPELVRVTYDGGYDDTTCPADIRRAILLQMQFTETRNKAGRGIMTQEAVESGSTTYAPADLHETFRLAVRAHRRFA